MIYPKYPFEDELNIKPSYDANELLHSVNSPTLEMNDGTKYWYKNGILHRENGPAIEFKNHKGQWYYEGERIIV